MRRMRLSGLLLLGCVLALVQPRPTSAHPLGNFTINLYSRLTVDAAGVAVWYVVDMAEIPTYQALAEVGGAPLAPATEAEYLAGQAALLQSGLQLRVDNAPQPLLLLDKTLLLSEGQGGLSVMRLELRLRADVPMVAEGAVRSLDYADGNYPGRLGWHEIVVQPATDVRLVSANVPAQDTSDALRVYPTDLLSSPLNVRTAQAQIERGTSAPLARSAAAQPGTSRTTDQLTALLATKNFSPGVMALALLLASGLGALHALAPGHGKTIVAAYLVGARGTIGNAVFLGLTVTITHTAGVFGLGMITLAASRYVLPEQLYPWLSLVSGLLVVFIGASLVWQRVRRVRAAAPTADHDHMTGGLFHEHGPNSHTHVPPTRLTSRNLLALGVSGGLLPCPSALLVLLGAISLGRLGLGMALILAFSVGLAGVITGIGVLMIYGRRWLDRLGRRSLFGRLGPSLRFVPLASALLVTSIGVVMVVRALAQANLLG